MINTHYQIFVHSHMYIYGVERKEEIEGKREQRSKGRKEEEAELSSSSASFQ